MLLRLVTILTPAAGQLMRLRPSEGRHRSCSPTEAGVPSGSASTGAPVTSSTTSNAVVQLPFEVERALAYVRCARSGLCV